jgi:predicted nucleic acid-binding protein
LNYILDACALIAFLNDEGGKEIVRDLLKKAVDREITLYISAVNLAEVFYGYIKDLGISGAQPVIEKVNKLPIITIDTIPPFVIAEASRLKGSYKMSTADAFGLAATVNLSGTFVTSDHHELEPVEQNEHINFLWLPPRPKK